MPRALEVLDQAVRRIEQGEIDAIGALDQILIEELSIRENRRIKTAQSHLATALAVETVKAGKSVVFSTLADLVTSLAKAEKEGTLRERIRYLGRPQLLVVDEIGYLPVVPGGGNFFFQLVNARYEKGAMKWLCGMGRGLW